MQKVTVNVEQEGHFFALSNTESGIQEVKDSHHLWDIKGLYVQHTSASLSLRVLYALDFWLCI